MWYKEKGRRNGKLTKHRRKGQFLGYYDAPSNIIYCNEDTKTIKTLAYYDFNELFMDLKNPPPNM